MSNRATEKIMEALSQLLEGFAELQDSLETEYGETPDLEVDEDADDIEAVDPDQAVIREVKIAIEGVIETDDYTPEEIANLIAALTEALEEVDPNIFADEGEEVEEDEEEEDDDEDYDDDDDEDLDLDDEDEDEDIEFEDEDDEEEEDDIPVKGKKKKK